MSVISADRIPSHWRTGRRPPKRALDPFEKTPLAQFVLLSMLVHALLIALFGAPSGGSREGRAMWGSLNVTLQGLQPEPRPTQPIFTPPAPAPIAPRIAPPPKAEVVPDLPRVETPPPPAEKPLPIEMPQQLQAIKPSPMKTPELKVPPQLEVPIAVPQMLERLKTPDSPPAELTVPPALEVPIVVPRPLESLKTPDTVPRELSVPPALEVPVVVPKQMERLKASDTVPRELSVPPALEVPVVVPTPIERVTAPQPTREMAPAIELPPPAPLKPIEIPAVPIPALTPPVLKQPVEAPVIPTPPVTAPVEKAAPVETQAMPAPPVTAPVEKSPVETRAIPSAPSSPAILSSPIESRAIPSQTPVERKDAPPSTTAPDTSRTDATTPSFDTPSATPRPDPSLRTPYTLPETSPFRTRPRDGPGGDYDPTKPSVDIDAAKRRAGELAREGSGQRALFGVPPPPKPRNKMEDAIEKARKPDCRTAYAGMGLLAIVPLVANEFGEGKCRW